MTTRRIKIVVALGSALSLLAVSAQAQDAKPPMDAGPAARTAPAGDQTTRKAPPPQRQSAGPAAQPGGPRPQGAPMPRQAGGPPSGRHVARAPAPARDWDGQAYRGHLAWDGGHWRHEVRHGRSGWWWDVGGVWYYYPQRMAGPPAYISEEYYDDVPVAYAPAPPPVAYAPPPPAPAPADPGASALGGAIVGGLLGGLISGNATGAAAGAVLGGASGAVAGAAAASQPAYVWSQGNCYYRYPDGQSVLADPRACR